MNTHTKNGRRSRALPRKNSSVKSAQASGSKRSIGSGSGVSRKYWVLKWVWLHSLAAQNSNP